MSKLSNPKKNKPTAEKVVKEPLVRVVKRENLTIKDKLIIRVVSLLVAVVIMLIFLNAVSKFDIGKLFELIFSGTFGSPIMLEAMFKDIAMLLCISVALAPAFKMRFWNIGAQGQILIGALMAAVCMIYMSHLPNGIIIVLMLIIGIVSAGIYAMIPAFFKVKFGTNETLFTLMMNYVAIQLVACCSNIWRGSNSSLGTINRIGKEGWIPPLFGGYGLTFIVAISLMVLMFFYLKKTKQGYEIAVVGESLNTARYAGINDKKVIIRTMFISGAICGLCGILYVAGQSHTISVNTGGSFGFTAIIVAWLARFNPFYMLMIAFMIIFLQYGSKTIVDRSSNLNSATGDIIVGIFLFCIIGFEFFLNYKLIFNHSAQTKINNFKQKFKAIFIKKKVIEEVSSIAKEDDNE